MANGTRTAINVITYMKALLKLHLLVCALVSIAALTSCGQKTSGGDQKLGGGPLSGGGTSAPVAQGTVDGGGGAGFKGLPLESYHDDIRKLPEYKNQVVPILSAIGQLNPDFEKVFLHIVTDRTWLFMNAPIPKLPNERQGTPFNIDQWGAQNSKEIQFSDEYKGSEEARGRILLHEILVGLKIMRFLSYNEYCYVWSTQPESCRGVGNDDVLIQDYKLDNLDHQDVRAMGDWLWDNYKTMNVQQFGAQMHTFQFQGPHYIWRMPDAYRASDIRTMNPVIDHMVTRGHLSLYTKFDYNRMATAKCKIDFSNPDPTHLQALIKIVGLKDKKVLQTLTYTVFYDPKIEIRSYQVYSVYERYVPINFDDGRKLAKLGDRKNTIQINFDNEVISEFGAVEDRVDSMQNGLPMALGDYSGPNAALCEQDPVEKPTNFGAWLEMRQPIRDLLERQFFRGKTWEERMIEAYEAAKHQ